MLVHMLSLMGDKPTSAADTSYRKIAKRLGKVCDELPMQRPILQRQVAELRESCIDLWEEHEAAWLAMVVDRSSKVARRICSSSIKLCPTELTREELYSHNPMGVQPEYKQKDEM